MATGEQQQRQNGAYVDAGGLNTYYEVNGEGDPLVLLHGGFCPAETLDGLTPGLSEGYRVYVPERRGQGRTADVEGPITYEIMAQDTIAFMAALDLRNAHVVGYSDGAVVAVHIALERPELVRKLVLIGQALNHDALPAQVRELLSVGLTPDILPPFLRQLYANVSPDWTGALRRRVREDHRDLEDGAELRALRTGTDLRSNPVHARRQRHGHGRGRRRRPASAP